MADSRRKDNAQLPLSLKQRRLATGVRYLFDENEVRHVTFSHSVMCQTSLPFRNQPGSRE